LKRALLIGCERIAAACAHRVICISRSVRDTVVRDGVVPVSKAALLGDRVSEGVALRPAPPAARLDIPKSAHVIGFAGRLTRDKGIRELAESFRLLLAAGLDVRLLLLGEFETGDPVDDATAEFLRTHPKVHCLGFVDDPSAYYPLMDVFVFPTHREGLGRVLLEAAAAGKPVVSTRTTGVVDVVVDGVTGLLVPPRDSTSLAAATRLLLTDRALAEKMGRCARRIVEEQFDNRIYLERLASMLNALKVSPYPSDLRFDVFTGDTHSRGAGSELDIDPSAARLVHSGWSRRSPR
jgi:glycosyltransferase involved in cell wall biosynthesis